MSRIQKGYEASFRSLLRRLGTRRLDQGVAWCLRRARDEEQAAGRSRSQSLAHTRELLSARLAAFLDRGRPGQTPASPCPSVGKRLTGPGALRFVCDGGLGGLTRWLCAAGYEAVWHANTQDSRLIQIAQARQAILLTTDSLLMERRLVREGLVRALWLSPDLTIAAQLQFLFRELRLTLREPRCMACGGELRLVPKERVWERIPPRTRLWLEDYFECAGCRQLFWRGTHWRRIRAELDKFRAGV
jgi:hypothetical protein